MKAYWTGMVIVGLLVPACFAGAASDESREEELLLKLERLEQRIEDLEARLAEKEAREEAEQDRAGSMAEHVEAIEMSPSEEHRPADNEFRAYWSEGLLFESMDGNFKLKLGGRIHNDWAWFHDGDDFDIIFGDREDGTELRRGRLYLSGQIYEDFAFRMQYDFADGTASFKDVWLSYNNIPGIGSVKVGHFKEPFGLEALTSSNNATFMERALPSVFAPSRNTGIAASNSHLDDRMTWSVGVFRETDDFGNGEDDGGYNVTARVTGLPWYRNDGTRLLHLGAGYSHRNPDGDVQVRQRPESNLAARYIDTGMFRVDDIDMYNAELALVVDRFALQGEYFLSQYDTPVYGSLDLNGYYVQGSVFLTPDHRSYRKGAAVFQNTRPVRNFKLRGEDRGPGAWELALRYSSIDLTDGWLLGGEEQNITVGLNWYLNPNMRVMLNYVMADIDRLPLYDDTIDVLQARFQVSF